MNLKRLPPLLIAACLFIVLLAFFYPDRVFTKGFRWGDNTLSEDIPQAAFFISSIKAGSFPLWNPYKACGLPFFELTSFSMYQPATLLYFLLPLDAAINSILLLHVFVSALFVFLLCREFNLRPSSSFLCSISWIFSNIFHYYSQRGYLSEVTSAAFLPGLMYLFIKAIHTEGIQRSLFSLCASILTALTITGGHPPLTAMVIFSAFIFILFSIKGLRDIKTLLTILLWALLLSIVYWGPAFVINPPQLIFSSERGALYILSDLKNFFDPITLSRGYTGILILVFGLAGLALRNPYIKNIRTLFLFALLMMFSAGKGFSPAYFLPIANNTNQPFEWHLGLVLSLIISAGFCFDAALGLLKKRIRFRIISLFVISVCIIFQIADLYRFNQKFYYQQSLFRLNEYFPGRPFSAFFRNDPSLFRVSNESIKLGYLRKHQGMLEGYNIVQCYSKGILLDRITGSFRLKQGIGWDPDIISMPPGLLNLCNIKYIVTNHENNNGDIVRHFKWEGLRDRLYPPPPEGEKELFNIAREKIGVYLYENKRCLPRAFILPDINKEKIYQTILKTNYTIPQLFFHDIPGDTMQWLANYKDVAIRWLPNTYEVSLQGGSDSFLFLSEMFYPGWKARLDGKAVKIETPFNFFMGIFVPPGRHTVRFYFAPAYYYVFAGISLVALVLLVGRLIYLYRMRT